MAELDVELATGADTIVTIRGRRRAPGGARFVQRSMHRQPDAGRVSIALGLAKLVRRPGTMPYTINDDLRIHSEFVGSGEPLCSTTA